MRYVELNPVRAEMVETPKRWRWSSAAAHCGFVSPDPILEMERWSKRWTVGEWRGYLAQAESATELGALRRFTHTGRPLGSPEFVAELEGRCCVRLPREKEAARRKPLPLQASSASLPLLDHPKMGHVPSVLDLRPICAICE
jgi:putative transposase